MVKFHLAPQRQLATMDGRSHSCSFDHRRRPDTLRTAMATAFFWPTRTPASCRACAGVEQVPLQHGVPECLCPENAETVLGVVVSALMGELQYSFIEMI
jgi:hypothetical protein